MAFMGAIFRGSLFLVLVEYDIGMSIFSVDIVGVLLMSCRLYPHRAMVCDVPGTHHPIHTDIDQVAQQRLQVSKPGYHLSMQVC